VAGRLWSEVNQLSGGSKAHWLARSFSESFLVRSGDGRAVEGAPPVEIVKRLLDVIEQAVGSLSRTVTSESSEVPRPRRFDFVHDPALRPVIEQAYLVVFLSGIYCWADGKGDGSPPTAKQGSCLEPTKLVSWSRDSEFGREAKS
jgi:hypothetical protein